MDIKQIREKRPRYRRKTSVERREILVHAVLACIVRDGPDKLSIRRIAHEAGVSVGLINHHYVSKEELVADAYRHIAVWLMNELDKRMNAEGGTPRERLSEFIKLSFSSVNLDPDLFKAWLAFWVMMQHSPEVTAVHAEQYAAYRKTLEKLFFELDSGGTKLRMPPRLAALGLTGLLDGLWLEWSLDPTSFTTEEGIQICEDWINLLKI